MYVYLILLKINFPKWCHHTKLFSDIITWVAAPTISWDPHIQSCFRSVLGAKPQPCGSAGPHNGYKTHGISVLLFENCRIHWERGGKKENKSGHSSSSILGGSDHNRKTKPVVGQSFLLFPNNFPLLPQPSSLLLAPNKSLGGGLAVPPQAVF